MEFSLHRELKQRYAIDGSEVEVRYGRYRVDVVRGDELIEIQHSGLSAIRGKVEQLLADHDVLVVKPLVIAKLLVKRKKKSGRVVDRRWSPKRQTLLNAFDELVSFAKLIPHQRLKVEVVPVVIEEWRLPGQGRRRRRRRGDFVIEDRKLLEVSEPVEVSQPVDLLRLLPSPPPQEFGTADLARQFTVPRWVAQRVAYCLRESGVARKVGKRGNAIVYRLTARAQRRKAA
ncbi:MAG: hypothetical protein MPJ50_13920 [Pirellulales bacterium]|nr:hypothetical protein [Pirellulales bacterium]